MKKGLFSKPNTKSRLAKKFRKHVSKDFHGLYSNLDSSSLNACSSLLMNKNKNKLINLKIAVKFILRVLTHSHSVSL